MNNNKPRITQVFKYIPHAAAALLVLTVSIALWYFPNYYPSHLYRWGDGEYQAVDGAWDLTGYDFDSYNVHIAGRFEYVIAHENEVVTKEEIYQAVWKQPFVSTDNALKGYLQRLRGKIDGCGYVITNVRGKGFCFEKG